MKKGIRNIACLGILTGAAALFFTPKNESGCTGAGGDSGVKVEQIESAAGDCQKKSQKEHDRVPDKASLQEDVTDNAASGRTFPKDYPTVSEKMTLIAEGYRQENGEKYRHIQIMEADFKYPLIKIDTHYEKDPKTGIDRIISRQEMVADHMIVKLRDGAGYSTLKAINEQYGASIRKKMGAPNSYLVAFECTGIDALDDMLAAYNDRVENIAYAEPDYIVYAFNTIPNDTSFTQLWGMHNTGQSGGSVDADIDAPEAWDMATGTTNVVVGVIDTGIDYTHVDLAANMWVNPGEAGVLSNNGVDDDGNGYVDDWHGWDFVNDDNDPMDDRYHGTHCAGTIGAAGNNDVGVAGVCWNVGLVGIKFLSASGSGTTSDGIDAIYYATGIGVDLTSNSWGGGGESQAMADAIADAAAHDILFVAAAGNNGTDNDTFPNYPSNYDSSNIIAVAAIDHSDSLAYFSCYGHETVDLGAPGVNVFSTAPGNTYRTLSGTSMATPHVAGACALLKSVSPASSAVRIKRAIMENADFIPALYGRCVTGARLNLFASLVQLSSVWLTMSHDNISDVSQGNGDGFINPGESVALTGFIHNIGSVTATNTIITVHCDNPAITVSPVSQSLGNISGGGIVSNLQYTIQASSTATTPNPFCIEFIMQDAGGGTWTSAYDNAIYTGGTLSGRVTRSFGTPLPDATVTFEGTVSGSVTTDIDGWYSCDLVDGMYTVWAALEGFAGGDAVEIEMPGNTRHDFIMGFPELLVTPTNIEVTVDKNETVPFSLQLSNTGDAVMRYEIYSSGYEKIEPGDPYNWMDISQTGIEIPDLGDDRMSRVIQFGFAFPFYGRDYTTFRVCGNGFIGLGDTFYDRYANQPLPLPADHGIPMIALFWDDLNLNYDGKVYYQLVDADKVIIQFENVSYYRSSDQHVTCQAVLCRDGKVILQYKNIDLPDSCTVGINKGDGTNGVTLVYNERRLENGDVISLKEYGSGWVSFAPETGAVSAGQSAMVNGMADAAGQMANTTHTTVVGVVNTDFELPHEVTVSMHVLGNADNHPPVAGSLTVSNSEDSYVTFTLPVSDADDEPLYIDVIDLFDNGSLIDLGARQYQYMPSRDYNGTDTMHYTATDLEVILTGRVDIITRPVNDVPYVSIRAPEYNAKYPTNQPITMRAYVTDVENNITQVVMHVESQPGLQVAIHETNHYYMCEWPALPAGNYSMNATAYDADGGQRTSYNRQFEVVAIRGPDYIPVTNMIQGAQYKYYEGNWDRLPLFESMEPIQEGLCSGITLTAYPHRPDAFGYHYSGYIYAPTSGAYRFALTSDDGSRLYVGGSLIVDNDGCHGSRYRSGIMGLSKGYHEFCVDYFDESGGESLSMTTTFLNPAGGDQIVYNNIYRDIAIQTNPIVYLKAPADGVRFREGEQVAVRVKAYDGNGDVDHVGIYDNGEWIGNATNYAYQHYVFEWPSVPVGSHTLYAVATDNQGLQTTSGSRVINVYELIDSSVWTNRDIGSVERAGWCGYSPDEKQFRIEGTGADIWGDIDEFHYVYQPMKGDMEIVARILSVENIHEWSKAGVMLRETDADNARHAMLLMSPVHGIACNARLVEGGETTNKHQTGISPPCWLRIVRDGDCVSTYYSINGTQWNAFWEQEIADLPETVYAGMAVCSHDDYVSCCSLFDNVEVSALGAVRISASAGALNETNTVSGRLRISRNGYAVTNALDVALQFSGSAENGTDYESIPSMVTIPVGVEYVDIPFVPINDDEVENDEIAEIRVQVEPPYRVGVPASVRVRIAENASRAWLLRYFTTNEMAQTSYSSDDADPDCDGIPNLEEFAFGYHPRVFEPVPDNPLRAVLPGSSQESTYPVIALRRRVGANELRYDIQASGDFSEWETVDSITEQGVESADDADVETVRLRLDSLHSWRRKFIRVRVVRNEDE